METKTRNYGQVLQSSGVAELVIGGLVMLLALGLFVYAFQSAATDAPYTASSWLIALALSVVGVFVWSSGMKKQRVAGETEQQRADAEMAHANAETVAMQAIERARKK